MNVGLGWLGVGVGAVGCVATYLMAGGGNPSSTQADITRQRRIAWSCAGLTLIATLIFWAVAMQRRIPFSPGQGLAYGFLVGGIVGAVGILLIFRLSAFLTPESSVRSSRLAGVCPLFYGLFGVSLAYSLFSSDPTQPLMGFAIGVVMAAILHAYSSQLALEAASGAEAWAVFTITIATGIMLAVEHFNQSQLRMWWPLPILMATSSLICSYVGIELGLLGSLRESFGKSYVVAVAIGAGLLIGLSAIYSWKVYHSWQLLEVVAAGVVIGWVIAWLLASLKRDDQASVYEAGAIAVLLVVAFVVVTFKLWAGLGISIGLIAAWLVAIPALRPASDAEERLPAAAPLALGLAMLLFRLYVQKYHSGLKGSDLEIHYTFISAMLGAILPFVWLSMIVRLRQCHALGWGITGVALMGLLAAASPILIVVLWGLRATLGFSFGLTAATAFIFLARLAYGDMKYSIGLLAIGAQLVAIEFVGTVSDVELTRAIRAGVLGVAVLLALVWLVVARRIRCSTAD